MKSNDQLNREMEEQRTRMRNQERNRITGNRNPNYIPPRSSHNNDKEGCFPGSTTVLVPKGKMALEDLKIGDRVLSWDKKTGALVAKKVLSKWASKTDRLVMGLEFEDGYSLKVTSHHTVLTNMGWKEIKKIPIGSQFGFMDDRNSIHYRTLSAITEDHSCIVYNLVIEDSFNFIADGCVANSFTHLRSIRAFLWTLYARVVNSLEGFKKEHEKLKGVVVAEA